MKYRKYLTEKKFIKYLIKDGCESCYYSINESLSLQKICLKCARLKNWKEKNYKNNT